MIKVSHPQRIDSIIVARELCPNCHSIYWDGKSCPSCEYCNLDIYIGSPFGVKSFFSLQEDYSKQKKHWRNSWGIFENENLDRRYLKRLERRFKVLCHHLERDYSDDSKLFFFEQKSLLIEYGNLAGDLSPLMCILNEYKRHHFFDQLQKLAYQPLNNENKKDEAKWIPILALFVLSLMIFFYKPIFEFIKSY